MPDSRVPKPGPPRAWWALPSAIVTLGLALRLYHLNYESVWFDEIFSLSVSRQTIGEMYPALVKDFVHPPLHYFLLHFWFKLVGFGPYQGRLLSVVFGTLAIAATYLLGEYLFGRRAASVAALLLAVSQLGVMYSQEARPYALLLFLVPCCSYLFLLALRTGRAGPWWGFVCTAILVVYTHYYGAFAIAALLVFAALYHKRYRIPVSRWIGGVALALALYLPWLSSGIIDEWLHSHKGFMVPSTDLPNLRWWTFLTYFNTFNNGRTLGLLTSFPWWTFPLGGVLFSMPALLALGPLVQESPDGSSEPSLRENVWFVVFLFLIPLAAALALAGMISQAYGVRLIVFVIVPYYLLVACGISRLGHVALRATVVAVCLGYSVYALRANYFVPYKEDYRGAYAYLAQGHQTGDCLVVMPRYEERQARWAWAIYEDSQPSLATISIDRAASRDEGCSRVWLISVVHQLTPFAIQQSKAARQILERDHVRTDARHYFWIDLDLYVPKGR